MWMTKHRLEHNTDKTGLFIIQPKAQLCSKPEIKYKIMCQYRFAIVRWQEMYRNSVELHPILGHKYLLYMQG